MLLRFLAPARRRSRAHRRPARCRAELLATASAREIQKIIREYLISQSRSARGGLRRARTSGRRSRKRPSRQPAVKKHSDALFNSPRGVTVGNPKATSPSSSSSTTTAASARSALVDMMELMKADPKLRVVLKEFPVLGPGFGRSRAGRGRRAHAGQERQEVSRLPPEAAEFGRGQIDKAKALAAAKEVGLDMARLEKDMASPEVKATLEESFKLAEDTRPQRHAELRHRRTRSWSAQSACRSLKEKIAIARCGKATC